MKLNEVGEGRLGSQSFVESWRGGERQMSQGKATGTLQTLLWAELGPSASRDTLGSQPLAPLSAVAFGQVSEEVTMLKRGH